jgi:hypothetical protein
MRPRIDSTATRRAAAVGCACLLAATATAYAQAATDRPATGGQRSGRGAVEAELAAREAAVARGAEVFLDRSRPPEERAAAVQGFGTLVRDDQIAAALQLLRDPGQPARLRALALHLVQHRVDRDDALVTDLLSWVRDPATPPELRREALAVFRSLMFSSFAVHARRPEFMRTLRDLTGDADLEVRASAFAILAAYGDDLAQQKLIACLKSPDKAPLPTARCVELLGANLHGDFLPVLDEVLRRPSDPAARVAALRLLGGYPPSRPEILRLLADPRESEEIRAAALATLNANDPEHFPAYSLPVVVDEGASDALRVYAIQAVGQRRGARAKRQADDFDAAVRRLAEGSKSAAVRRASGQYLRATGVRTGA